jgi:hypothetical protein
MRQADSSALPEHYPYPSDAGRVFDSAEERDEAGR